MQQCYSIPQMSTKEFKKLAKTIKPIICYNGDLMFLNVDSPHQIIQAKNSYSLNYSDKVDLSTLGILTDVKMLHTYTIPTSFEPSVGEILSQIPEELRNTTVAFEIIYSPYGKPDFNIFNDEFNQNFHVSIVRLYQKNRIGCPKAEKLLEYPTKSSCLPIYMEAEKFNKLLSK